MKTIFFFCIIFPGLIFSGIFQDIKTDLSPQYQDDELVSLWESLSDIYSPNVEDFKKIQNYLRYGQRPYLDVLVNHLMRSRWHGDDSREAYLQAISSRVQRHINFIDRDEGLPTTHIEYLGGSSPDDKQRCIILYASFNSNLNPFDACSYTQSLKNVVNELREIGYRGHVLYHLGGYPLLEKGSARFVHIPYAFKLLSFLEAYTLGYQNVLWIDTSIHPTNNLENVFEKIKREGSLLIYNGIHLDYDFYFFPPIIPIIAMRQAGIRVPELAKIPHVVATIIGISFQNQKSLNLLEEWYRLTSLTIPAMTLYPEECLLSISSWKTNNKPNGNVWDYFDVKSAVPIRPIGGKKPFWFDKS
jgi:hypothetical protein